MKLKKGDEVKVVAGKDKGKTGKVEKVFPDEQKVLIVGINEYKRHIKGQANMRKSEIVTIAKPLFFANVALICSKCHLATRAGYQILDNKKERICKKCKQTI
ncbi:MAG: 50S ribosomal protein L24 [Candidatus Levyibacteriota bacterium]|nr:MAG: 50S ribosomal protein L24 [Candidatus Levybacteria bacterium]